MSAPIAATWGAEAEVPKKFGKPSGSVVPGIAAARSATKNVVLPPSGPVRPGLMRTSGNGKRRPVLSNRIGTPPADENSSMHAGAHSGLFCGPNADVLYQGAAPTASAPAA